MKLLLIEGSPKLRRSASSILLDGLRDHLEDVEIDTCAVKSAADSGHAAAALTVSVQTIHPFKTFKWQGLFAVSQYLPVLWAAGRRQGTKWEFPRRGLLTGAGPGFLI